MGMGGIIIRGMRRVEILGKRFVALDMFHPLIVKLGVQTPNKAEIRD